MKKFDFYEPIFDPIGEPRLKSFEFFGYTSRPLFSKKASRKSFRRNK